MGKRKVFIDFEYLNRGAGHPIDLISVGMVDDRGNEFYGINVDAPLAAMWQHKFLREVVWPTLPLEPVSGSAAAILDWDAQHPDIALVRLPDELREDVYQFLIQDGEPELWGSYSGFDYVLLSQLWGTFEDHRPHIPMFINDIQQFGIRKFDPTLWENLQKSVVTIFEDTLGVTAHHALHHARMIRAIYNEVQVFM